MSVVSNIAKPQAFPLALKISSRPLKMATHLNPPKPLNQRTHHQFQSIGPRNCMKVCFLNYSLLGSRSFSTSNTNYKNEGQRNGKSLPWLSSSMERGRRKVVKNEASKGVVVKSSWEESAEKFLKGGRTDVEVREKNRNFEGRVNEFKGRDSGIEEDDDDEGEGEVVNDPRWRNIRNRFDSFEKTEVRRWDKQENWGRKTWKEAKESTLPKIVGEGVYGVGPVLAALSAGRREFYALYIQEGLEFSSMNNNNKKKKDKKGFEKVLKLADKIGLSQREVSKHDLNMVSDNRPHQGLVLDASPLEMVGIKELEPVSMEGEKNQKSLLWLALDEVTDPQNLGAIIRSAYFFGACGVVLCAKNSAPLSGVVSKASAGALELMEIRSCKNMMQFLTNSSGNGWRVLGGSVSSKAVPLNEIVAGEPTILVLGSEGTGLRPLVERSCTQLTKIPGNIPVDVVINGDDEDVEIVENVGKEFRSFLAVESLNVSVAAGVMLNHLIGSNYMESGHVQESDSA